jgi:hypothetical protein
MLLVNNPALPSARPPAGPSRLSMGTPLLVRGKPALLASPLNIQTHIISIAVPKKQSREEAIRRELKFCYPGDAACADIDYFPLPPAKNGVRGGSSHFAVFTATRETGARYREKKSPLIPGIVLLLAAGTYCGAPIPAAHKGKEISANPVIAILITPLWIEIASFKNSEIIYYTALDRKTVFQNMNIIEYLYRRSEKNEQEKPLTLMILKDVDEQDDCAVLMNRKVPEILKTVPENTGENSCHLGFPLKIIKAGDLGGFINTGKQSIYRRPANKKTGNRNLPVFVSLSLTASALLFSFSVLISKTKTELVELNKIYSGQQSYHQKAEILTREIGELEEPPNTVIDEREGRRIPDPYAVLAEIHRHTDAEGALIHSIIIQRERFSFEAIGADSLKTVKNLAGSPYFSNLTLHQSSPSASGTERFSVSGSIVIPESQDRLRTEEKQ